MFSSWTVSCVIPTKNRIAFLPHAIESVLGQEGGEVDEVILVDDGSSDGTVEFVQERYPRVKVIRGEGLGPGRARNAGASAASGEVLMFLDSDDRWTDDHC